MGIFRRAAVALATASALTSASVAAGSAAGAAADPYSPTINTVLEVRTPDPIRTDVTLDISVQVTANSPDQPTGTIRLDLKPAPGGAGQSRAAAAAPGDWSRTVDYNGGKQTVRGPQFPKAGEWVLSGVFTPDDPSQFRSDGDTWRFTVIAGNGNNGNNDGDDDGFAGGLLPDTGGPALLWLLLGLGLLGGGATAVVVARQRREPGPAPA